MSVFVINMIPKSLSGETNQDSEPNLAVNPANPQQIAATAFTPDPLSGSLAPIFVSTDGGNTWALNLIVPGAGSGVGFYLPTADITLKFGGLSNVLYGGILRADTLDLNLLRTSDYTSGTQMTVLVDRANEDQPWVQATTAGRVGGAPDRVYVGNNDFNTDPKSATIDPSQNAATAAPPAGFAPVTIASRTPGGGQNGPSIRPVVHADGTVYAAYFNWQTPSPNVTADVVVCRDDNWGQGGSPFSALIDAGDHQVGARAAASVQIPWANYSFIGQERAGSHLSIAVDPNDSSTVYLAWCDYPNGNPPYSIHLRRSTDRGATWSGDLRLIANGINPAVAINVQSKVGFLYQTLINSGNTWESQVEISSDGFATAPSPTILASVPSDAPVRAFFPYLGDYIYLAAVGKDFYGVFCANNTPSTANFPNSVVYLRNANFTTQTLLDVDNATPVPISIDPFFFKVTTVAAYDDFYVRDWTDSPTSGDTGLEPSNHPVFWSTGDVWNRRGTLPGTPFPNDQPVNEDAGNGSGNLGDNWAFARIRRNEAAPSGSQTVTAHFLVSEFGTGSNFVDNISGSPDITFDPGDPTVTFNPTDTGPIYTSAYHWHLSANASTHLCIAVEITGPNDPYIPPSLAGNTPGWPTTDLRIVNDNNKAQRNMGLTTTPARGVGNRPAYSAVIHNAATFTRDMTLQVSASADIARRLDGATVSIDGAAAAPIKPDQTLTFSRMTPGENRTITVEFPAPSGDEGEIVALDFHEVLSGVTINGFSIGARLAPDSQVLLDVISRHLAVFQRLDGIYRIPEAKTLLAGASGLVAANQVDEKAYLGFLNGAAGSMQAIISKIPDGGGIDRFHVSGKVTALSTATSQADPMAAAMAHIVVLEGLNAWVTSLQLAKGNVADILQNVRWQEDLYGTVARLAALSSASSVRVDSNGFIAAYSTRKAGGNDYPALIAGLMPIFRDTAQVVTTLTQQLTTAIDGMKLAGQDLVALQKAHRDFLLALETLR